MYNAISVARHQFTIEGQRCTFTGRPIVLTREMLEWVADSHSLLSTQYIHNTSANLGATSNIARKMQRQCTGWPKKLTPFVLYALTLPNINRFSKLLHTQLYYNFGCIYKSSIQRSESYGQADSDWCHAA